MIACINFPLPDDHRVPLSCEATLRLFLDHAPAAVAMFDRNMRYLHVSRRWLVDYGLTGQEIIGRSHYEIFPEIPEHWKAVHQRCLAGATEQCEEEQFRRLDGEKVGLRWEVFPWHDAAGTIGGIIITTETTTERTRMTGALRESEEHYRSLFNGMTEGFALHEIVCDEAGAPCDYRILEINPAFEQLTGLSREQTVGKLLIPSCVQVDTIVCSRQGGMPWREGRSSVQKRCRRPNNYVTKQPRFLTIVRPCQ